MRRFLPLVSLAAGLALCFSSAVAEPMVTNGTYTAYLGENNWMYLVSPDGTTRYMRTAMADLPSMQEDTLYCLTASGSLWSVMLDGSSSTIVSQAPTEDDFAQITAAPVYSLNDGVLTIENTGAQADQVLMACSNGDRVYYIRQEQGQEPYLSYLDAQANILAVAPQTWTVAAPLSMTATNAYVCIVTEEHALQILRIADGQMSQLPAVSENTVKAICLDTGMVIRYTISELNAWETESITDLNGNAWDEARAISTATASVTQATATPHATLQATATPRPTATVRPTATAKATTKATAVP